MAYRSSYTSRFGDTYTAADDNSDTFVSTFTGASFIDTATIAITASVQNTSDLSLIHISEPTRPY